MALIMATEIVIGFDERVPCKCCGLIPSVVPQKAVLGVAFYAMQCQAGVVGPAKHTITEAIEAWNEMTASIILAQ